MVRPKRWNDESNGNGQCNGNGNGKSNGNESNNSSISRNESELELSFKQLAPAPLEFQKEFQPLWKKLAPAPKPWFPMKLNYKQQKPSRFQVNIQITPEKMHKGW